MAQYFTIKDDFQAIIEKSVGKTKNINQIATGWTNFVFDVETEDNAYIFRFPRNDFFSSVLEKEVAFSQFLKGKIKTPTTNISLNYDNGRPFTRHDKIKGKSLTEKYPSLHAVEKVKIADQVAEFIYELQAVDFKEFDMHLPTTSEFLANLSRVDDVYYDFSRHNNLINLEKEELVLNHADLNPGNILLDKNNNICAVLDFAFVSVSCKINDVARLIGRLPEDFHEIMLDAYNEQFSTDINMQQIKDIVSVWDYVEEHYINYMRENQPEIDIGR